MEDGLPLAERIQRIRANADARVVEMLPEPAAFQADAISTAAPNVCRAFENMVCEAIEFSPTSRSIGIILGEEFPESACRFPLSSSWPYLPTRGKDTDNLAWCHAISDWAIQHYPKKEDSPVLVARYFDLLGKYYVQVLKMWNDAHPQFSASLAFAKGQCRMEISVK